MAPPLVVVGVMNDLQAVALLRACRRGHEHCTAEDERLEHLGDLGRLAVQTQISHLGLWFTAATVA